MKQSKRVVSLLLAILMVLSLAACSQAPAEEENPGNVTEQPSTETPSQENADINRSHLKIIRL